MRRILSAITVVSLAFSLVALATPANAAVAGYDSAYAGESAFLTLAPGSTGTFTVFFANTGSTSWVKGSATQVDLAACLDDKVTCNSQDATEAPFNSGWLSTTRYASTTQSTVAPGQIGTFTYNVAVPAAQAAGTYRFNGAVVLASSGADIRNEGYYQDVTVAGATGTAAITTLTPSSGTNAGGTSVVIAGSGIVCTPAFPTVAFGANNGTVTSCGATSITVTSPAGAVGAVNVTVTNTGAAASNALTYTYTDATRPAYTAVTVTGGLTNGTAVLTFSEAVCESTTDALAFAADFTVTVNGIDRTESGETLATCSPATTPTNAATSFTLTFAGPIVNGDTVAVTLNASGADSIRDVAGNLATAQTQSAIATGDTTAPSITTVVADSTTVLKLTYGERVQCNNAGASQFSATPTGGSAVAATSVACTAGPTGSTTVTVTFGSAVASTTGGNVTYTADTVTPANRIFDINGNAATTPETDPYAIFSADATAPTLIDTRFFTNSGFTTQLDATDVFKVVFSEAMNTASGGDIIRVTDADGTTVDLQCGGTINNATCTYNAAAETVGGVSQPAGTVLTVLVLVTPGPAVGTGGLVVVGTTAGLQIPVTITDTSGITDTTGNSPNIAGSADRIIDVE